MKRFILLTLALFSGTQLLAEAKRVDGPYTLMIESHNDIIGGRDIYVYHDQDGNGTYTTYHTRAGIAQFTDLTDYSSGSPAFNIGAPPMGLCVELGTWIDYNKKYTFDLYDSLVGIPVAGGTISAGQAEAIEYLFGNYFEQAVSTDDTMSYAYTGGATTRKIAPALQVAVWEVLYDGVDNFDVSAGDFYAGDANLAADAEALWTNMSKNEEEDRVKLYALYNETTQDFALFIEGATYGPPPSEPIPLSGSGVLLLSGGLAFVGRSWRKRMKSGAPAA